MLSVLASQLLLPLYRLRMHPSPHEALQLVHARLLAPSWLHQAEQLQAERPRAHQQASLVSLQVGQQVSLRLCWASLNVSLTLLNAQLQHSHRSPMLLSLEELPELQGPQAHEMLLKSLHSQRLARMQHG